jgi:MATE family multidrug resistance protein
MGLLELAGSSSKGSPLAWESRPARELVTLAWPIAVSTISYSVMTLVDTLLVGRLGTAQLAGVGLGGTAAFVLLCFSFGLLRGAKTLVAQAIGAGRRDQAGAYLGAALFWALLIGVGTMSLGLVVAPLLARIPDDPAAGRVAAEYLSIRCLGAPFVLAYIALREVRYGLGDARTPMTATVLANVINMGLGYLLIFPLGFGVAGAAAATVVAHAFESGFMLLVQRKDGFGLRATTRAHIAAVWRIGVPTGIQFSLEVGAFGLLAAMISRMGTVQMAGHQIALQVIHFMFMPGLALSEASSVLSGQAVGAGRLELVKKVALVALKITTAYTGLCTVALVGGSSLIVRGFTDDVTLHDTATHLLWLAALFQVVDGGNVIIRGVLRGAGDVRVPAVVGVVTSWVATPPLAWLLGFGLGLGALGGWIGITVEIFVGTVILWWRLLQGSWQPAALAAAQSMRDAARGLPAEVPIVDARAEA